MKLKTKYTYEDKKGQVYPVYLSKGGKAFIWRKSQKTGKDYRQYIPEIGKVINPSAYQKWKSSSANTGGFSYYYFLEWEQFSSSVITLLHGSTMYYGVLNTRKSGLSIIVTWGEPQPQMGWQHGKEDGKRRPF